MRLFLDAHLPGRRIATALRDRGHDVRSADEERALDGWPDESILELASSEQRILVTCDVKDFARITRRWAESGRIHAGCILLVGIDHGAVGAVPRAVDVALAAHPVREDWCARTAFTSRRRP
ncbi:MAG: DUF5615 family PIN-like protein [Egibacteraceae bacterium]